MPAPHTADRPRIVQILNCYGADQSNKAQLVIYADGTARPFGCPALIRAALLRMNAVISPALTDLLESCAEAPVCSPTSTKRRRRASSSEHAQSADAVE
jgi:hypothetical protein